MIVLTAKSCAYREPCFFANAFGFLAANAFGFFALFFAAGRGPFHDFMISRFFAISA
jgi:hypothetical protein